MCSALAGLACTPSARYHQPGRRAFILCYGLNRLCHIHTPRSACHRRTSNVPPVFLCAPTFVSPNPAPRPLASLCAGDGRRCRRCRFGGGSRGGGGDQEVENHRSRGRNLRLYEATPEATPFCGTARFRQALRRADRRPETRRRPSRLSCGMRGFGKGLGGFGRCCATCAARRMRSSSGTCRAARNMTAATTTCSTSGGVQAPRRGGAQHLGINDLRSSSDGCCAARCCRTTRAWAWW